MIDTAVVFAAGVGSRMEDLTQDLPKPLLTVWGKPLLDHILTKLVKYGVRRVFVNLHYLPHQLQKHLHPWRNYIPDLILTHEESLLGAGGTVWSLLDMVEEAPFFTINGDVLWKERTDTSALTFLEQCWKNTGNSVLALIPKDKAWGYRGRGDFFMDDAGHIQEKLSPRSEAPYVYGGIQLLTPAHLRKAFALQDKPKRAFGMNTFWSVLIRHKMLTGCPFPDPWYHIGDKAAYRAIGYV